MTTGLGAAAVLLASPLQAAAAVVLDMNNPLADFQKQGNHGFTPSPTVLQLNDASDADFINFFADDPDAAPGIELDVVVNFQILSTHPFNADNGVRFVINDGQEKAVIVACITRLSQTGIGVTAGNHFTDPDNYAVFVPVNWTGVTALRFRRTGGRRRRDHRRQRRLTEPTRAPPQGPARQCDSARQVGGIRVSVR